MFPIYRIYLLNQTISLPMCFKSKPENSFSINQYLDCYSITLSLHEDHGGRSEIMKEMWIEHIKVI